NGGEVSFWSPNTTSRASCGKPPSENQPKKAASKTREWLHHLPLKQEYLCVCAPLRCSGQWKVYFLTTWFYPFLLYRLKKHFCWCAVCIVKLIVLRLSCGKDKKTTRIGGLIFYFARNIWRDIPK